MVAPESRHWPEPDNACEAEPVGLFGSDRMLAMLQALARAEARLEHAILHGTQADIDQAIAAREGAYASATVLFTSDRGA
jgi:hypothetical protein